MERACELHVNKEATSHSLRFRLFTHKGWTAINSDQQSAGAIGSPKFHARTPPPSISHGPTSTQTPIEAVDTRGP
jgi:hypothetical protein